MSRSFAQRFPVPPWRYRCRVWKSAEWILGGFWNRIFLILRFFFSSSHWIHNPPHKSFTGLSCILLFASTMDCEFRRGFWGGFWEVFEKIFVKKKVHQKIRFRRWIFFCKNPEIHRSGGFWKSGNPKSAATVDFENPKIQRRKTCFFFANK